MVVGLSGCSKPPDEAKTAVETAKTEAKDAGAETYAAESFSAAQAIYDQATAEQHKEEQKGVAFRRYTKVEEMLNQAKAGFEKAKADAEAGKVTAKTEAEQAIADAKTAVEAANAALVKVKARYTKADMDAMMKDLATHRKSIADADSVLMTGDFAGAKAKAMGAMSGAVGIQGQVEGATTGTGG
jgi:hypothetical protein